MRDDLFRKLEAHTTSLVERLKRARTSSVLQWVADELTVLRDQGSQATGLSSPLKQLFHLLGLMLVTPSERDELLTNRAWATVKAELQGAFLQYMWMFFPTKEEARQSGPQWAEVRQVAMAVYLERTNSYPLLTRQQLADRISELFTRFDPVVLPGIGLTTSQLVGVADWIWRSQEERLQALFEPLGELHDQWERWKASGESLEQVQARVRSGSSADLPERLAEAFGLRNVVNEAVLGQAFGEGVADRFLREFSTERGRETGFRLLGDENPAESRPLIRAEDGRLFCVTPQMLLLAILARLQALLAASTEAVAYYRHRDKLLASKAAALMRDFLGGQHPVYESVFRTAQSRDENDVAVRIGTEFLAVEAKAMQTKVPPRDPDRAFRQIEQDFRARGGIQGGYEQAIGLRNYLMAPCSKDLYDERGRVALTVPQAPQDVVPVIVTWDSWGALASDLTLLLQKGAADPFPWVVSIDQLELALEGFRHEGKGPEDLLRFLHERQRLHGHVNTADELEIVGAFLENDGFSPEWSAENTVVTPTAESARLFDRIEAEKRGVVLPAGKPIKLWDVSESMRELVYGAARRGPVAERKVGRNDPCPCGSGKTFKRCHGR